MISTLRTYLTEPLHMSDPPTNIRALQAQQTLEITWPEGTVNRLPYLMVRSECPCATCRNEWTGERVLDPGSIPVRSQKGRRGWWCVP